MIRKIVNVLVVIAVVYVIYEMNRYFYWQGWSDGFSQCSTLLEDRIDPQKYVSCREDLEYQIRRNRQIVMEIIEAERELNNIIRIAKNNCDNFANYFNK